VKAFRWRAIETLTVAPPRDYSDAMIQTAFGPKTMLMLLECPSVGAFQKHKSQSKRSAYIHYSKSSRSRKEGRKKHDFAGALNVQRAFCDSSASVAPHLTMFKRLAGTTEPITCELFETHPVVLDIEGIN
jgi:hypothetical protein